MATFKDLGEFLKVEVIFHDRRALFANGDFSRSKSRSVTFIDHSGTLLILWHFSLIRGDF